MSRAQEFLAIFNEIESLLYKKVGATSHKELGSIIYELANTKRDRVVLQFKDDLREYSELRNALVHQSRNVPIADPYPETVEALERLKDALHNPKTARSICTSKIISFESDKTLKSAVREMTDMSLTNVPITSNDVLIGVLSEQSIVRWLASINVGNGFISAAETIDDIKDFLDPIDGNKFDMYKFVKPDLDVYTIQDMFATTIADGKRLAAVFVTHNGKPTEKIIGIITAWDLSRI